jgi:mono/diheme cytochrome c family protein
VYALLISLAAQAAMPTTSPPDRERGENLYRSNCWQCHGAQGLGDGPMATGLSPAPPALAGKVQVRPELLDLIMTGRGTMPGAAGVMDRKDAERVVLWLAQLDPTTGQDPEKKSPKPPKPATPGGSKAPAEKAPDEKVPAAAPEEEKQEQPASPPAP